MVERHREPEAALDYYPRPTASKRRTRDTVDAPAPTSRRRKSRSRSRDEDSRGERSFPQRSTRADDFPYPSSRPESSRRRNRSYDDDVYRRDSKRLKTHSLDRSSPGAQSPPPQQISINRATHTSNVAVNPKAVVAVSSGKSVNHGLSVTPPALTVGGTNIERVTFVSKEQRNLLKKQDKDEKKIAEKRKEEEVLRKRTELDKYRPPLSEHHPSSRRPLSNNNREYDQGEHHPYRDLRRDNNSSYNRNNDRRRNNNSSNTRMDSSTMGDAQLQRRRPDVAEQQPPGVEKPSEHRREGRSTGRKDGEGASSGAQQQQQSRDGIQKAESNPEGFQKAWTQETESNLADLQLLKLEEQTVEQDRSDLEQIREHYLGLKKEKKKIQKPSEKFRNIFNFEWNVSEDTLKGDNNELYLSRLEPQLLFGRGFRAGIDVREQRRHNNFYDELIKRRSDAAGEMVRVNSDPSKDALIRSRDIEQGDKNRRHWTDKSHTEMTDRDWRIFREDFEIYIKGGRVPPPARKWEECGLPEELLQAVRSCGYEKPTPIQMQAIPIALDQRDLIGIAETGSGKTAAFVLPMLTYVKSLPVLDDETSQDGPYALVLAPSRELALQIDEETKKFASFCKCRTVAIVGGRSAEAQAFELRRGCEIVTGTPGRIKDCLEKSYTVLSQCNYVILDEADRMIDLGFEEVVNWILDQIPSSNLKSEDESQAYQQELEAKCGYRRYRLTQMFSATMPPAVERLSRKYLKAPAFISIGDPGAGKRAIEQRLEFLSEGKKKQRLEQILQDAEPPIMVFVNQKKIADVLAKTLQKMGYNAASLHGGKAQDMREQSLNDFKQGLVDILVATDVAGRGIDVEGVQLVVNFDMPKEIVYYTHRIGRTGRAGKKGFAVSFLTEDDSNLFYDLKQLLLSTNNVVPHELATHPATKLKPEKGV